MAKTATVFAAVSTIRKLVFKQKTLYNAFVPKAYVYQGNSLVVPEETPDSSIQEEINLDLIDSAFNDDIADRFTVSSLDKQGDIHCVTVAETVLPRGWKAIPMRQALNTMTGGVLAESIGSIGRIFRSYHVSHWRSDSLFCGRCGAANRDAETEELARQCTACGRLEFPRISPAVIFIVTNDKGQALLARNKNFLTGVYSVIAGFNEAGESLEATVAREVKEEVNIEVCDIRYIRSQPWPFPNSLMLGFAARYKSGELRPDGNEIVDAGWYSKDSLPTLPGSASVSRYLINLWLDGKL